MKVLKQKNTLEKFKTNAETYLEEAVWRCSWTKDKIREARPGSSTVLAKFLIQANNKRYKQGTSMY